MRVLGRGEGGLASVARAAGWLAALVWLSGCGESTPAQLPNNCPAGLKAVGKACAPVFDTCKQDEISLPGGGCKKVGVEECNDGIQGRYGLRGPPDWKCKPIGPPATCLTGWRKVAGGWCEPLLPTTSCPDGTMEVLGKATCQPIGDCGTGNWGDMKTGLNTLFVDAAYPKGDSTGSSSKPYRTIKDALNNAKKGAHIAIAAGAYNEDVKVRTEGVTLDGRCARMVTIKGQSMGVYASSDVAALWVNAGGVTLRGVTVSGPWMGIAIASGGGKAVIERVAIKGCFAVGLWLNADTTVRDTLIRDVKKPTTGKTNQPCGVVVSYETAPAQVDISLQRVVVREVSPAIDSTSDGNGILVYPGGRVSISHSLVTANASYGVSVFSGEVILARSVVSATREQKQSPYASGLGARVIASQPGSLPRLTLRDCLIKGNDIGGVYLHSGGTLLVERSVVTGNLYSITKKVAQGGIAAGLWGGTGNLPEVTVRDSLVQGNHGMAVYLKGAKGLIERSVLKDTLPDESSTGWNGGFGVYLTKNHVGTGAVSPSTLTLRDSLVAGSTLAGINIRSSRATLERVVVRDTRIGSIGGTKYSFGIWSSSALSLPRSVLKVSDSLVTNSQLHNLYIDSTDATLERTVVRGSSRTTAGTTDIGATLTQGWYRTDSTIASINLCLFTGNERVAILCQGATVNISRSVVRDTRAPIRNDPRDPGGEGGQGIVATRNQYFWPYLASTLTLSDSLVSGNHAQGVQVTGAGSRAEVRRCAVTRTHKDLVGYGDGLVAQDSASLMIQDSLVDRSARAGVLFDGAGGSLGRSVVRAGIVAVAVEEGARPTISQDNVFINNREDRVISGGGCIASSPPAVPPPPPMP